MLTEKHKQLQLATDKTLASLGNLENMAKDVLDIVVSDVMTKFHHKLGAGVEDSVADLLDDFKQKIVDQIINEANRWRVPKSDIVIFPKNCRFFYEKGDNTIVVIEEEPRKRSIRLRGDLTGGSDERHSLPMPYVVFIFNIKGLKITNTFIGWRSTPLMRTSDRLARPLLPNCHSNLEVCWGSGELAKIKGDSIAELTENAITHYWSGQFNGDLSDRWKEKLHPDLVLGRWSNQDTLFMMSLDYHKPGDQTVEQKIKSLAGHIDEPNMDEIRHRLFDLTQKHSDILFSKIIRYFKKVKPERFYPKDVTDLLKGSLESCTRDYLDVFYLLQFEYNKLESRIKESEGKVVKKRGAFWN